MSNIPGMKVSEAMETFHSRINTAQYMWDIPKLLLVPDVTNVKSLEVRTLEEFDYDVENGLYPNVYNGRNDVLVLGNYVYIQLCLENAGEVGVRTSLHVLDMNNHFAEVAHTDLEFLYSFSEGYVSRFYHDMNNHLYIIALRRHSSKVEIWESINELQSEFRLLAEKDLPQEFQSIIMASSRNNSFESNVATMLMGSDYSYHYIAIDFSSSIVP